VNEESDELERAAAAADRLVHDHLDRLASRTDATALIRRLQNFDAKGVFPSPVGVAPRPSEADEENRRRNHREGSRWNAPRLAWVVPTVAVAAAAFFIGRWLSPSTADAAQVVTAARAALSRDVDRSYRATFHPDPDYWDGKNVLRGPSETILWTRGDRFWAETRWDAASGGHAKLVYGRDEKGTIWLSPSRSSGTRFSSGQTPEEIELYCAINSMTASRLLDDVLADFDLQTCDSFGGFAAGEAPDVARRAGSARRTAVMATLKPGKSHPFLSSALLEIDESDALVRLILWTLDHGKPRGTMTYTLVETADLEDDAYRLSSHVDEDAEISERAFEPAAATPDASASDD
jgi:hypothetical protein